MSQQVPATRMNLTLYKTKQVAAKKGFDLLKSKADALKVRFRDICKKIYETKVGLADQSSDAFFSLTAAEYAAGNFRNQVLESSTSAAIRVSSRTDNVAGVKLPVFKQYDTGAKSSENIGLNAGGRKVAVCKEKFSEYLQSLIKVASLQTSFLAMDEALKITNRRVNALENVTIPKIVNTINDINRELDELEREDFTRLKVVKRKKEEALKLEEKLKAAEKQAKLLEQSLEVKVSSISINDNAKPVAAVAASDSTTTAPKKDGKKKKNKNKKSEDSAPVSALAEFEEDEDVVFR
eukprot:CAMPEP_0196761918 /NCGR_PEP_ID=MMETSP1095-20130614/1237_1 /TAXON_ID=96789 ORGANISM="Chromulina nebulosa, Strain UTEXLB2642" /NCGR_SAMPLE_ID=MMETSP1095 /ASSEMBLY_ACC=CAM_ASM_000446 /LENGTH=293 /DNA_ID=CAMNT_0042112019 /DNA_START=47 /DNA_END=928 /DNA_ORIENTATION=+